jgi:acetyl-CoA C-acetyltransferase
MATGIKDKVAIIGMGCTRFGERWDVGAEELMVEAFKECLQDAGIGKEDIGAAWLGTCFDSINVGRSALPMSLTLRLPMIPVTRVSAWPWVWRSLKTPAMAACPVSRDRIPEVLPGSGFRT